VTYTESPLDDRACAAPAALTTPPAAFNATSQPPAPPSEVQPMGQATHWAEAEAAPTAEALPAAHSAGRQVELPPGDHRPTGQTAQPSVLEAAPAVATMPKPERQLSLVQRVGPPGEKYPTSHTRQSVALITPPAGLPPEPGGHASGRQLEAFDAAVKRPAAHVVHAAALPGEELPAPHVTHVCRGALAPPGRGVVPCPGGHC
jgi:hypothetical protein